MSHFPPRISWSCSGILFVLARGRRFVAEDLYQNTQHSHESEKCFLFGFIRLHRHPLRDSSGEIVEFCIVHCLSIAVFIGRVCVVKSLLEITLAMPEPTFSTHTKKLNELNLSCSMKILLLAVCNHAQNEKKGFKIFQYRDVRQLFSVYPLYCGSSGSLFKGKRPTTGRAHAVVKKPLGNYLHLMYAQ